MFLRTVLRRNPALVRAGIELHQSGAIPPNCFVLDIDAIGMNAERLVLEAAKNSMALYFMTKQIGHNPPAVAAIRRAGLKKAVAVDVRSAAVLHRQGVPIGNVGHLSQVPHRQVAWVLGLRPEVVTVFSVAKAEAVSCAAARAGRDVDVLLGVWREGDLVYPGQEGGFRLDALPAAADKIARLPRVRIAGVTAFPCLEYVIGEARYRPTPNLATLIAAAERLESEVGIQVKQINAPGATCIETLSVLRRAGATHAEPGHALSGTTPHQAHQQGAELPSMIYVSEVSHLHDRTAFAFGGGVYRRGQLARALIGRSLDALNGGLLSAHGPGGENIDYYFAVELPKGADVRVGDTVVCAFRAQIFISYAFVAAVAGLQKGQAGFVGLFEATGCPVT